MLHACKAPAKKKKKKTCEEEAVASVEEEEDHLHPLQDQQGSKGVAHLHSPLQGCHSGRVVCQVPCP